MSLSSSAREKWIGSICQEKTDFSFLPESCPLKFPSNEEGLSTTDTLFAVFISLLCIWVFSIILKMCIPIKESEMVQQIDTSSFISQNNVISRVAK